MLDRFRFRRSWFTERVVDEWMSGTAEQVCWFAVKANTKEIFKWRFDIFMDSKGM